MPHPGQQHDKMGVTSLDTLTRVFRDREASEISSKLEKKLGPEFISQRLGNGGKQVPYLSADKAISLANEVFSFRGWSSSIQQIQVDYVDENANTGKVSLGLSVIIRVTLKDGTFHEDIGYGSIENCKSKAAAFEKAKKEGTTDGLKRALRNFGNVLGNCLYDKEYCAKVTRMKALPVKWDPEALHRHRDFVPTKKEVIATDNYEERSDTLNETKAPSRLKVPHEDEFGNSDDFNECDFAVPEGDDIGGEGVASEHSVKPLQNPDITSIPRHRLEPTTPSTAMAGSKQSLMARQSPTSGAVTQSNLQMACPDQVQHNRAAPQPVLLRSSDSSTASGERDEEALRRQVAEKREQAIKRRMEQQEAQGGVRRQPESTGHDPPVGFFTARAAESLQNSQGNASAPVPSFDPHLESPSIRKTAGIDHSKTKPINRDAVGSQALSAAPPMARSSSTNVANPQTDRNRKLGMPSIASPLANRGSYKPPQQIKRPADGRSALNDVTSTSNNTSNIDGTVDAKRPRIGTVDGIGISGTNV